jgi:hypothetical protein
MTFFNPSLSSAQDSGAGIYSIHPTSALEAAEICCGWQK